MLFDLEIIIVITTSNRAAQHQNHQALVSQDPTIERIPISKNQYVGKRMLTHTTNETGEIKVSTQTQAWKLAILKLFLSVSIQINSQLTPRKTLHRQLLCRLQVWPVNNATVL